MDDLFKALQMYSDGVQQFQMGRSIAGANDAVQQIRASDANEAKKRADLQQVANSLTLSLASQGVPATTIQAVGAASGPVPIASAEDAFIKAGLAPAGSDQAELYKKAGEQALKAKTAEAIAIQKTKNEALLDVANVKGGFQEKVAGIKANQQAAQLDTKSREEVVGNINMLDALGQLKATVAGIPDWQRVVKGKLGGKNVDPSLAKLNTQIEVVKKSVADAFEHGRLSDADAKYYNNLLGSYSDIKTPDAFLAPFDTLRTRGVTSLKNRAATLESEGKRVDFIKQKAAFYDAPPPAADLPPGIPPGSVKIKARSSATGQTVDAWKAPDGKLYRE